MRTLLLAATWLVIASSLAAPPLARADEIAQGDCESRARAIRALADQMPESRKKVLVQYDLQRVDTEVGEADEAECLQLLDHATQLLLQVRAETGRKPAN